MDKVLKLLIFSLFGCGVFGFAELGYYQAKAELAQVLLESAWEQTRLQPQSNIKPWPWADTWPVMKLTLEIKSPKGTIQNDIAKKIADKNNLSDRGDISSESYIVLADSSGESLAFGPGVLTPDIVPGSLGNSIIAAHRDTHFSALKHVKVADEMSVELKDGSRVRFSIDNISVVDSNIEEPILQMDEARLTLVTCYPFDLDASQTSMRMLVSGIRVASF